MKRGYTGKRLADISIQADEIAAKLARAMIPGGGEDAIIQWTFQHGAVGQVHITSEASRHWRKATVRDVGNIVLFFDGGKPINLIMVQSGFTSDTGNLKMLWWFLV